MKVVLILEDDPCVLDLLCLILRSRGYAVVAAVTAEDALGAAARHTPKIDLLIADIVLTFSTGIQVGAQLRRRMPSLKILLISGYPADVWRDNDWAQMRELPDDALRILQKPFFPQTLMDKVVELIGSSEDRGTPRCNGGE
jgi:two-component system cell cycle sensor histidine kinase/response regulator CckA